MKTTSTVTMPLSEYNELKKLADKGERFECMSRDLSNYLEHQMTNEYTRIRDICRYPFIKMSHAELVEFIQRWML